MSGWPKQTAAEKAQAYADRRTVRPELTPKQAEALIAYLMHAELPAGKATVLAYARSEIARALGAVTT